MLIRFIAKRVAVLAAIFGVGCSFFVGIKPLLLAGLTLGALVGVYKIRFSALFFSQLEKMEASAAKSVFFSLFSQIASLLLLIVCALSDWWLFGGVVTGMLLPVGVICINAVTERLGITKNAWGEKEEERV